MKQFIIYLLLLLVVSACGDTPQEQYNDESQADLCDDSLNQVKTSSTSDSTAIKNRNQEDSLSNMEGTQSVPNPTASECTPLKVIVVADSTKTIVVADSTKTDSVNVVWVRYGNGEIEVGNGCEQDSVCIMTLADSCRIVLKAQQDTVVACCEQGIVLQCHQAEVFLPASFYDEMPAEPEPYDRGPYFVIALVELGLILLLIAIIFVPIVLKMNKKKGLSPRLKKRKVEDNEVFKQLSVENLKRRNGSTK